MTDDNKNALDELEDRIESFRRSQTDKDEVEGPSEEQDNMRLGLRAGAELVGAIAVSSGIGWYIDKTFDTKPIFLLVMLILGVITGFVNVWRTTQGISTAIGVGYQTKLHEEEEQERKTETSEEEENLKDG